MRSLFGVAIVFALNRVVLGTWNQCGGIGWTGSTVCPAGDTCVSINPYYSQCLVVSTTTVAPTTSTSDVPTKTVTPPTTTFCPVKRGSALQPRSTGPPLRASTSSSWAYNSYIQRDSTTGKAVLGPAASRGWFLPYGGGAALIGTCPFQYLNVATASTSYKPLVFDIVANTSWTNWTPLTYANQYSTFIACSDAPGNPFSLYVQTGSALPSGNCTTTQITTSTS